MREVHDKGYQAGKLITPSYPVKDGAGVPFGITTQRQKIVADYAGISLFDVYQLDIFTYWALLHDAIVTTNAQTEEGRKWLHDAWRIQQTTPDAEKLHQKYG